MRSILISAVLALAVIGFSGCGAKGASCAKPTLPSCATPCTKKFVPCPCP